MSPACYQHTQLRNNRPPQDACSHSNATQHPPLSTWPLSCRLGLRPCAGCAPPAGQDVPAVPACLLSLPGGSRWPEHAAQQVRCRHARPLHWPPMSHPFCAACTTRLLLHHGPAPLQQAQQGCLQALLQTAYCLWIACMQWHASQLQPHHTCPGAPWPQARPLAEKHVQAVCEQCCMWVHCCM
jgi:hypothetical protein